MNFLKKNASIIELILALIISILLIQLFFTKKTNFENAALGRYTKSYFASIGKYPIQTLGFRQKDSLLNGIKKRNHNYKILFLGNSQTHSINQYKKGDYTFIKTLADSLNKNSIDVVSSSVPNATLMDFYLLYKGWQQWYDVDLIFIPAFLDDTREDGVQDVFYDGLNPLTDMDNNKTAAEIKKQLSKIETIPDKDLGALNQTYQEKVERYLNDLLANNFKLWELRPNIRGQLFNNLYKLRNTVFRIDATTKRKVIKISYNKNIAALKQLLLDNKKNQVRICIYIPPLRKDHPIPYLQKEYTDFKKEIELICNQNNANFLNLEDAVPDKYWGYKGTRTLNGLIDIDFMHFQTKGHILFAYELLKEINKIDTIKK
jgi:hypothetical protein